MSGTITPSVRKNSVASSYINSLVDSTRNKNSNKNKGSKKYSSNKDYERFQESVKTLESKCFVRRIGDGHFGEVFEVQLPFGEQTNNQRTVRAALKTSKYYSQKNNQNIYKEYDVWSKLQIKLQNKLKQKMKAYDESKTKENSNNSSVLEDKLCVAKLIGLYYFNKPNITGSLQKYLGIAMKLYKYDLTMYMCEISPVDQKHILKIARQMVQGVAQLHSVNVFHGDLSRRNFLVDFDGTIVLTDFGLSHKMKRDISGKYEVDYTVNRSQMGRQPVWWFPPEVIMNTFIRRQDLVIEKQTDVYMLGCSLLELRAPVHFVPFFDSTMYKLAEMELLQTLYNKKQLMLSDLENKLFDKYDDVPELQEAILAATAERRRSVIDILDILTTKDRGRRGIKYSVFVLPYFYFLNLFYHPRELWTA